MNGQTRIDSILRIYVGLGVLTVAFNITSHAVKADDAIDRFGNIGRAALLSNFKHALPEGLSYVDDTLAVDERNEPYWLPAVRADKPGFYLLRHSCLYDDANPQKLGETVQRNSVYYFYIGEKGDSRIHFVDAGHTHSSAFDYVYPTACEGDTIVTPIRISSHLFQHEFSHTSCEEKRTEIVKRSISEPKSWLQRITGPQGTSFNLTNHANMQLRLLGTEMSTIGSRRVQGPTTHTFSAAFEAKQSGEFNLQFDAPKF